ncbi:MAG: dihydrofolate reductase family protein [Cyclobacteriaceae bacterium]
MGRIVLFNMITLDGFFEGTNQELDWHQVDDEFNEFAADQLDSADFLLFGRRTYQLMEGFWPTKTVLQIYPGIASRMNRMAKIVCSRTMVEVYWQNTILIKQDVAQELTKLKFLPTQKKDILVFGSAELAAFLGEHGLIDEYRIMVNPVVLGNGTPLFRGVKTKLNFSLVNSRTFTSGKVLLNYVPVREGVK